MKMLTFVWIWTLGLESVTGFSAAWTHLTLLGSSPLLPKDQPSMETEAEHRAREVCQAMPGLVPQQQKICDKWPESVGSVPFGTKQGLVECEYQFRNSRWNCSDNKDQLALQSTLQRGSKETAFLYAITSAGVVHAIAKACSSGNLTECNCDLFSQRGATPEGWKWGGCSDNLKYGLRFSRNFLDAGDKGLLKKNGDIRNLMNLHNNEAGRRAIAKLMLLKCRCHGVSGSCEFKTCWRSLPPFSQIGEFLKEKYDKSAVKVSRSDGSSAADRYRRGAAKGPDTLPVSKRSLVYIQQSPDYCNGEPKTGVFGTTGRRCSKGSKGNDGCDFLCCGRGFKTEVVVEYERCKCKFVWCCKVRCKECRRRKYIHTCK